MANKLWFFAFTVVSVLSSVRRVFAQSGDDPCPPEEEPCLPNPLKVTTLIGALDIVFNFLFTLALVIAPIIITVGGIMMLFAAGNEEKIRSARKAITYALVGLIIVVVGKGLVFMLFLLFTDSE